MKIKCLILTAVFLLAGFMGKAQITQEGTAPSYVKWNRMESGNYRMVYPRGLDSLAKLYLRQLEQNRIRVGLSAGFFPNQAYRRKMPVVLQAYNANANGTVFWAPVQMELNSVYDPYDPEPLVWEKQLAIHESRHVAQLQFGRAGKNIGYYLTGDLFAGVLSSIYPGNVLLEGDAVVAETALSDMGRGRSGDFLEYMRMAAVTGDNRNWYQWRWGSQNKYVPDYYRLGYMTVAGARAFWDDPLFMKRYFANASSRPLRIGLLKKTMNEKTGKNLNGSWEDIVSGFRNIWEQEDAARKPSPLPSPLTSGDRLFSTYSGTGGGWAIRRGLAYSPYLVRIGEDGTVGKIRPFAQTTSKLSYDGKRLWWSEYTPDTRWKIAGSSRIRYMEPGKGNEIKNLTLKGRYFNPSPAGDGEDKGVVAVEYPLEGGSYLVGFDPDGRQRFRYRAPDSLQLVEPVVLKGEDGRQDVIYTSAISEGGFGIYSFIDGHFSIAARFGPVKIKQLSVTGKWIVFTSDMDGTDQIYGFDPSSGLWKFTNTPYGASYGTLSEDDILTYTALSPKGKLIYRSSLSDLRPSKHNPGEVHTYPVAETLSRQERSIEAESPSAAGKVANDMAVSEPEHYRKGGHLFRIHSWAPVYFNYDNISNTSFDDLYYSASPGATVFFQNDLGTLYGLAGYSFHEDFDVSGKLKHSGHVNLTYSGLYPVIQISADYNDRNTAVYTREAYLVSDGASQYREVTGKSSGDRPFFSGTARIYVPVNLSSGGWLRGIVPQVEYKFQNDEYDPNITWFDYSIDSVPQGATGTRNTSDKVVLLHQFSAALRAYSMLPTANSAIYPRLGIGAEIGLRTWNASDWRFAPTGYAYVYGYLPGIMDTHGIRLSAIFQKKFSDTFSLIANNTVNTTPRGFSSSNLDSFVAVFCPDMAKFTCDYALPFLPVDWSLLSPLAYVKNFEAKPFFDFSVLKYNDNMMNRDMLDGNFLYSCGADISIILSNLLWFPFDCKTGIRMAYNGGSAFESVTSAGVNAERFYTGLIFSTSF